MPIESLELELRSISVKGGAEFQLPQRFTVKQIVGRGFFGVVCSGKDEETGAPVAIKKLDRAFDDLSSAKQALRELKILRHLRHENIIDLRYLFVAGSKSNFEDIYIISGLMETDMASILRSPHRLSDEHCQFFLYQILRGLKYVHSAGLVHGSLKPRILLVNSNCDLKISDFWVYRPPEERVCNRWYVAPEVLCSLEAGAAIDMWALGLIFAEMVTRKPLLPGNSVVHQLQLIIRLIGFPEADILSRINEKPRRFMESLPKICGPALYEALRPYEAVASVMELLDSLLQFDPDHRLNAEQALALPYFEQLHCPQDEPSSSPIDPNDFEFERRKIDLVALREEIFLEALHYHPDVQRRYLQELAEYGTSYDITKYRLLAPDEPHYDD